ncbi:MAG: iron-sulfur cluster assembly accessory protein [Pseudomonadota bacterium]|nr:iron-sulfur cluster assembly accessory protein [Pseudomonadota bacterium]
MTITLTEAAARQIRSQIAKRGKGLALRVGVKTVGCSGLAYTYALADEVVAGDVLFEGQDAKVVVDAKSLAIIDGARLDFVTEGLKQSFQFDNPNADSTCGCGESFNLKATATSRPG